MRMVMGFYSWVLGVGLDGSGCKFSDSGLVGGSGLMILVLGVVRLGAVVRWGWVGFFTVVKLIVGIGGLGVGWWWRSGGGLRVGGGVGGDGGGGFRFWVVVVVVVGFGGGFPLGGRWWLW